MHRVNVERADSQSRLTGFVPFALLIALSALLVPVLVAAIPPLTDYPNHLSRLWLLGGGADVPLVSGMYRITWDALTNIGIDLLAVALSQILSYDVVGRLFIAAAVLLPAVGGVALWRVLHGRFHWWQLSFALLAWSMGLLTGFLNFEIGLGLALLATAADSALARHGAIACAVGRAALAGLLLLVHAFAFIFYAALLCGIALGPEFRAFLQRGTLLRVGRSVLVVAATLALPALLFLVLAPSLPGKHADTNLHSIYSDFQVGFAQLRNAPGNKLVTAFIGIRTYAVWLDALTLVALGLPVLVSLALRRLTAHAGMLLVVGVLLACYVVLPNNLAGTWWIDRRFAFMAPLALVVALRPELPLWPAQAFAVSLLVVSLVRTGVIGWVWHERQADVAALSRALASVPPGAAILPLEHQVKKAASEFPGRYTTTGEPSYRHLPTLALPWRQAFVPTLFTAQGKQPVQVLPHWNEIVEPDGGRLSSVHALVESDAYAQAVNDARYLKNWQENFDYVLVMNADVPDDNGPFMAPSGIELVMDEGFAQLYRIKRSTSQALAR